MPPLIGRASGGAPRSPDSAVAGLRAELEEDIRRIEGENSEIDMLMEQVLIEIERHETRRSKMEGQLAALETSTAPNQDEISEMRTSLLALTRRELLFDAQRQVLEGKQRGLARFLHTWDGFPAAQQRFIAQLAGIDNPVVLTGDYHQGMTLDVRERPFDQSSALVAPEFMAPPISSLLFGQDVSPRTPHLREQLNNHGYLTVDIEPERLTARFRVLADVAQADTSISTASTWQVTPGDPNAQQV